MHLKVHTLASAPPAALAELKAASEKYGFVPNLLGVMADAPVLLKAYSADKAQTQSDSR
jgi:hypothetical protein